MKAMEKESDKKKPDSGVVLKKFKAWREANDKCRDAKAEKALDKANEEVKKKWTEGDIQQKGVVEQSGFANSGSLGKPKEKKEAKKKEGGKKKAKKGDCPDADKAMEELEKESDKKKPDSGVVLKKFKAWREANDKCR